MIKRAISDNEIMSCYDVISELRTHLLKEDFLSTIRHMEPEGYKLVYIAVESEVVAVAGYRSYTNLFMGKHLYIDDLITSQKFRSQGFGNKIINHLREEAKKSGCKFYHLDSGTQRSQAHKFYFQQGFTIASYHFSEQIE